LRNGDISNELPKRIIVVSDVLLNVELSVKKKYRFIPVVNKNITVRRELLSLLYMFTVKKGVTLELISYSLDDAQLGELIDSLDSSGTNPFRYYTSYTSMKTLIDELPYRPEVIGVLDVPKNLLRYGHWGLDFNSL
jgi:hypothetical protein